MKKQWIAALVGTALVAAVPAWAHTDKYFDSVPSPHGGQTRMAGPYHIELVTGPGELTAYLADHGNQDISTAGGEGKAVVRSKEGEMTIALTPTANNILKGKGEFTLGPGSTVVVFVKLPGAEAWAAKFTPLKPEANASTKGMDHDHEHHHEH